MMTCQAVSNEVLDKLELLATIYLDLHGDLGMHDPKSKTEGQTLWNASAGAVSYVNLASANLEEVAKRLSAEVQTEVKDRVGPYETPVTLETLRVLVP